MPVYELVHRAALADDVVREVERRGEGEQGGAEVGRLPRLDGAPVLRRGVCDGQDGDPDGQPGEPDADERDSLPTRD